MVELGIGCRNNCGKPAWVRGVCKRCHAKLQRQVNRKETTWDKLEAEGKVNPKKVNSWGR